MATVATGITVAFGTSGFTAEIIDVNGPSASRGEIDFTHQGTTTCRVLHPTNLWTPGELSLEIAFDAADDPTGALENVGTETITITYPKDITAGAATDKTWAFSGFMSGFDPSAPFEDKMTASITVKVCGDITVADIP